MDRKIENAEWKIERLKQLRKRCMFVIASDFTVIFIYVSLAYFLNSVLFIVFGAFLLVLAIYMAIKNARAAQSYSQEIMIYKLADPSFQAEWNDYVTTIDYTLSKQYEAYLQKRSKD